MRTDCFTRRLDCETVGYLRLGGFSKKSAETSVSKKSAETDVWKRRGPARGELACADGYRVCLEIGRRAHFPLRQASLVTLA